MRSVRDLHDQFFDILGQIRLAAADAKNNAQIILLRHLAETCKKRAKFGKRMVNEN